HDTVRTAVGEEASDRPGQRSKLHGAVGVALDRRRGTVGPGGSEALRAALRGEKPIGRGEDLRGRAVVLGQGDHPGAGMTRGEPGEVGRGRTGEGVDRLVLV